MVDKGDRFMKNSQNNKLLNSKPSTSNPYTRSKIPDPKSSVSSLQIPPVAYNQILSNSETPINKSEAQGTNSNEVWGY